MLCGSCWIVSASVLLTGYGFLRPKPVLVISSSHVVRVLALYGPRDNCNGCGSKMFVKSKA